MSEDLHLVSDLALILISAGIITIIFKLLKQPLVLGYIVAGFLVGPNFKIFPTVVEQTSVHQWSEIGIIFLLFALGLEFSFRKLFKVGATAIIASAAEIVIMFCVGFFTGYLMKWTVMESIFLGGMLAMSSTTIIIKAFDDLNLKKEKFADITMVILIIQDIVAILMMVLLSTAAVSQQVDGADMLMCILKLIFFMVLWFVVGISIIPTFFRKAKKYINDETLLIISIGLCFGMVVFANYVGFSSALGAFVMGSILSETIEAEHIERLLKSVKDLFGAIFFVSVGMMVDPQILIDYWPTVLALTLIVLVVKALISSFSVLIAGEDLKTSLQVGFSLSQIGEFAFILAEHPAEISCDDGLYHRGFGCFVEGDESGHLSDHCGGGGYQYFHHAVQHPARGSGVPFFRQADARQNEAGVGFLPVVRREQQVWKWLAESDFHLAHPYNRLWGLQFCCGVGFGEIFLSFHPRKTEGHLALRLDYQPD